jgi:hypothetical protein
VPVKKRPFVTGYSAKTANDYEDFEARASPGERSATRGRSSWLDRISALSLLGKVQGYHEKGNGVRLQQAD